MTGLSIMKKLLFAMSVFAWMAMPVTALSADQSTSQKKQGNPAKDVPEVSGGGKPIATMRASGGGGHTADSSGTLASSATMQASANVSNSGKHKKLHKFN